jgi:hypothetical protein
MKIDRCVPNLPQKDARKKPADCTPEIAKLYTWNSWTFRR